MSYKDDYSGRLTTPSGWRPDNGINADTPPPDAASNGGGEFYEYYFRSGTGRLPQPRPPGPSDTTESSRLAGEAERVTEEVIRVTAEAARLQAEVTRLAAENKELEEKLEGVTLERSAMDEEVIKRAEIISKVLPTGAGAGGGEQTMLIYERVGSVSLDFWVGMSESKKRELGVTLETIANKVCDGTLIWESIGEAIRNGLAPAGIRVKTKAEFLALGPVTWATSVMNTSLPIKMRVTSFLDGSASNVGDKCYAHETVQFLWRLMNLRRSD